MSMRVFLRRFAELTVVTFFCLSSLGAKTLELDNSDKNLRIGIVGAGPSGLLAARKLQERGFTDVTVLEATSEIGGKVRSLTYKGFNYEMGAVITAPDNRLILKIAEDLNIKMEKIPDPVDITSDGDVRSFQDSVIDKYGYFELIASIYRFRNWVKKNDSFFQPGFKDIPEELLTTYDEFAKKLGIEAVSEIVNPVMVGCGYGFSKDMPAAYWVKLMKTFAYSQIMHRVSGGYIMGKPFFKSFPGGWQNLWREYVKVNDINVQLNQEVKSVYRYSFNEQPLIEVETSKDSTFVFDRLIVSVPHLANKFMDLSAEESDIFDKVNSLFYKVSLVEIDNLPQYTNLFPREYSTKFDSNGQPNDGNIVLLSSNKKTNIYQVYQFTSEGKSSRELQNIMRQNIGKMKGNIVKILEEVDYNYFPHFPASSFLDGSVAKLEAAQGSRGVYYTGALMNFETVEFSARHGEYIVEKFFTN